MKNPQLFQIFTEIGIIHQLARTEFNRRLPEGLHLSHFAVINHLFRLGDGRTPNSIARAFQVTKATMTNTLSRLSARDLIEISPNPADGRSKLVYLTAKGREFHPRAISSLEPTISKMAKEFDMGKIEKILPVLTEIRVFLDENRNDPG